MKKIVLIILTCLSLPGVAQKYIAETSSVGFFSHASIEDISATNIKANSIFDLSNGEIAFTIPNKEFKFAKSLMQEHFNEKYMETEKFPKSNFQGKILGYQSGVSGLQQAKAVGKLTIHGVTKEVEIPGTLEFVGGNVILKSKFVVKLEDYDVKRPQLLWKNIAEQVEVTIDFTFKPHEKK